MSPSKPMRIASHPRSAQEQVEHYRATLLEEGMALVMRGVPARFIVYVVRNGPEDGRYDRLGAFFYTLEDA